MGQYATSADVIGQLGDPAASQLTTDTVGDLDDVLIDLRIAEVEAEANGYVQKRMSVPVVSASHPRMVLALRGVTIAMTIYRLATRRPPVPEDWKMANDKAIAWLKGIADGTIDPPDDTAVGTKAAWGSETPIAGQLREW